MKKNTMRKMVSVNQNTVILAIDIGKTVHYGYLRGSNNQDIKPFPFHNSIKGFEKLWEEVLIFRQKQNLEYIVVGFESTGPYAEPLLHFLSKKPVKLVQVNPMHVKRLKELTGNSPNKTDMKDPRAIADIISLGHALTVIMPEGPAAELRRLTHARERAIKQRTSMSNQLQHLLSIVFPEFLQVMKNVATKSSLYLLKHYPSQQDIIMLGRQPLTNLLYKISRGKIGKARVSDLYEAAKRSIGVCEGNKSILMEIQHLVDNMENQTKFIDYIEKRMSEYLHEMPYSSNILSINGIGAATAAGLVGEIGDFYKFTTISEIMKLAGLDLYEVSSGQHKGQRHISKRGRPLLRKLLFFTAIKTVRSHGIMHQKYSEMLNKGTPKVNALVAIARRLLRIIFALVRKDAFYNKDYMQKQRIELAA